MKKIIKNLAKTFLLGITIVSCDSTSDSVTPTVIPSTFEFLYMKSPNAHVGNQCNIWNLKNETTAGSGFATPTTLRSENLAPSLLAQTTMFYQCSAYDKINKKYVISSGERILVYDVSSSVVPAPTVYMAANIQAMEFVNGRFFIVKNHNLKEFDIATGLVLASFTTIPLLSSADVSNMAFTGNFLYIISSGSLYKIDTAGSGSVVLGYPLTVTSDKYEGLEYINSAGVPNSLYAIQRNSSGNYFVKIDPALGGFPTTIHTLTFPSDFSKISSALDYTTEFYYLDSSNGFASGSHTLTPIDLTPPTGPYTPTPLTTATNNYLFGLQLKD
jgi:hypothetical protein